jgi:hypothetical protein
MKTTLHIVILVGALIAVALLAFAWRSARRDTAQLNSTLASQNTVIQQAQAREQQRDAQLITALAAIAAQERAIQTPLQAAQAIPSLLSQLPLPISVQLPNLSAAKPGDTPPPATITLPQADLKPLYDDLQNCRASADQLDTAKKDLTDEQARTAALTRERDAAVTAAHGGTFWVRLRRGAKWFVIGATAGAAAAAMARH